jgi:hypothetical protein
MRTTDPRLERFRRAYLLMASEAKYRPQAPSDGFGNIQLELDEVRDLERLWAEVTEYALRFSAEEDSHSFWVGCSDYRTSRSFVWSIEAARLLASGDGGREAALKLLRMAAKEVAQVERQIKRNNQP